MTIEDEILAIANQIANKGQKPTIALVKPKLSKTVPLPMLIAVLKTWQHDADFVTINTQTNTEIENNHHDKQVIEGKIAQQIEQAIAPLRQEINELKTLIVQLVNANQQK